MEIKFTQKINDNYIKLQLFKIRKNTTSKRKSLATYLIICVVLFSMAALRRGFYGSFWNPWTSLGIAMAIMAIIYFIDINNRKVKTLSAARKYVEKFGMEQSGIEYVFSDERISVRDPQSYAELSWSVFNKYRIYENHLLIYGENSDISLIQISKNQVSEKIFDEILGLVRAKLPTS